MKKRSERLMVCVLLLLSNLCVKAQNQTTEVLSRVIPLGVEVGTNKTTNLIFPYPIKSVDRGNPLLLVQKAKGVENILQVKAGADTLKETTLTVVCSDANLYSFLARYNANPTILNLILKKTSERDPVGILNYEGTNESKIYETGRLLAIKSPSLKRLHDYNYEVGLACTGIYIKDDLFYFQLQLSNESSINYDIDQMRFILSDQKKINRTAFQEIELQPNIIIGDEKVIPAGSKKTIILTINKFTIPDQRFLSIVLNERNGGRHLSIKIQNKHLIKATRL